MRLHEVDALFVFHDGGLLVAVHPFQHFADELGCSADEDPAIVASIAVPVFLNLLRVLPIDLGNVAAEDAAVCNFIFKTLQKFLCVSTDFLIVSGGAYCASEFQTDSR